MLSGRPSRTVESSTGGFAVVRNWGRHSTSDILEGHCYWATVRFTQEYRSDIFVFWFRKDERDGPVETITAKEVHLNRLSASGHSS